MEAINLLGFLFYAKLLYLFSVIDLTVDMNPTEHNPEPGYHSHKPWHLRAIYPSQSTYWYVFGRWEETRKPTGNPQGHRENMENSTQAVTSSWLFCLNIPLNRELLMLISSSWIRIWTLLNVDIQKNSFQKYWMEPFISSNRSSWFLYHIILPNYALLTYIFFLLLFPTFVAH